MQQHPVPQNVTQYQFRLVGDMTLKQFLELAAGLVLAWLFYASNLIFFIKWPLALLSLFGGIAMAFFPIEERPLDVWLINFIKSIYQPTRFVWQKTTKLPSLFSFSAHPIVDKTTATKTVKAPPVSSLAPSEPALTDEEQSKLNSLDSLLSKLEGAANKIASQSPQVQTTPALDPKTAISPRKLKPASVIFKSSAKPRHTPKPKSTPDPKTLAMPREEAVSIPKASEPAPADAQPKSSQDSVIFEAPSVSKQQSDAPLSTPQSIKLPAAPTSPNLVVGMVVDQKGHLVENAIVQLVTEDGIPARAIKTNSLGQFFTSTPLKNGSYILEIEKEGLTFPRQSLEVEGDLISPLLLRAA